MVKCSEMLYFDIKEVLEWGPKLEYKNRSMVIDDRIREAVILHHSINNYFCQSKSINQKLD